MTPRTAALSIDLLAIGDRAGSLGLEHHRADERAVPLDGVGVGGGDARIRAHAIEVVFAEGDRELLDAERIGAGLAEDGVLDRALSPWMSATTAMIDVTATMLPSTVMNDRSFDAQIAASAMPAASRNLFICRGWPYLPLPALSDPRRLDFHGVAVGRCCGPTRTAR